ncbi:MAG: IS66 family transposase [Sphaerochaeta sp.]
MKIELTKEQYLTLNEDQRLNAFFGLLHLYEELNIENKELRELHELKTKIDYVPSSEQMQYLFTEAEILALGVKEQEDREKIEVKGHSRNVPKTIKELPASTPIVVIDHTTDAAETFVDENGLVYARIEDRVVDKLGFKPAEFYIERHLFAKYALVSHEAEKGDKEKNIITKWDHKDTDCMMASMGTVAQVVVSKYDDQLPLYRQEEMFKRINMDITRQTLSLWLMKCFFLLEPLVERLRKWILLAPLINQDESPLQVLHFDGEPTASNTYFMFVQVGTHIVSPQVERRIMLFTFLDNRKKATLLAQTEGYDGFVCTDGLKNYNGLPNNKKIHINCWVHAVRPLKQIVKVHKKAKAKDLILIVNKLYTLEKELRGSYAKGLLTKDEFNKERQERAGLIFAELKTALEKARENYTPSSTMGKAISYFFTYWDTLINYPKCFESSPSNNVAESAIRPYCVGKKNWLFSNTDTGAHASALFYSLIETAKANHVNPYDYVWYILTKAPLCKTEEDWDQLLPWNMDNDQIKKMHDTRNSAAPDPNRTSPYIIRGAKDRDPLKEAKLAIIKARKEAKEVARAIKKAEKKDETLAKIDRLKKKIERADKARDRVAKKYGLKVASTAS